MLQDYYLRVDIQHNFDLLKISRSWSGANAFQMGHRPSKGMKLLIENSKVENWS